MPCAGCLPCVSPPQEVMVGTGHDAPRQVLETPAVPRPGYMALSLAGIAFWQTEDGQYVRRLAMDACKQASIGCRVVETVDSTP